MVKIVLLDKSGEGEARGIFAELLTGSEQRITNAEFYCLAFPCEDCPIKRPEGCLPLEGEEVA